MSACAPRGVCALDRRRGAGRLVAGSTPPLTPLTPPPGLGASELYVVKSGEFEVLQRRRGVNLRVNTKRRGDTFGEVSLMYNCPRSATVAATQVGGRVGRWMGGEGGWGGEEEERRSRGQCGLGDAEEQVSPHAGGQGAASPPPPATQRPPTPRPHPPSAAALAGVGAGARGFQAVRPAGATERGEPAGALPQLGWVAAWGGVCVWVGWSCGCVGVCALGCEQQDGSQAPHPRPHPPTHPLKPPMQCPSWRRCLARSACGCWARSKSVSSPQGLWWCGRATRATTFTSSRCVWCLLVAGRGGQGGGDAARERPRALAPQPPMHACPPPPPPGPCTHTTPC